MHFLHPLILLYALGSAYSASASVDYTVNSDSHAQKPLMHQQPTAACDHTKRLPPATFNHLAQYSPWFPAGQYTPPPEDCTIDQVHILHRHASRFPTEGAGRIIKASISRMQTAIAKQGSASTLSWLLDYSYNLGSEELVPFGVEESKVSALCAHERYGHLASQSGIFVRASSSHRVVATAKHWSKALDATSKRQTTVPPVLVISDGRTSNDTLANNGCPLHKALRLHWQWAERFTSPIASRLQRQVKDYDITALDILILMSMCPFQSVADERVSKFCNLFTEQEFRQYEYFNDLEKYYNTGYGNPLGPVLGVGYVSELIARLTNRQVEDCTQTNSTLDSNKDTFPLERGVYADFSHDNTMAAIVSAIGLFSNSVQDMPLDRVNEERAWKFGHIAPFAGRIVFERLACKDGRKKIRVLANDALLNMTMCGSDENDMCTLEAFVDSQRFSRIEGQEKWKECFKGE